MTTSWQFREEEGRAHALQAQIQEEAHRAVDARLSTPKAEGFAVSDDLERLLAQKQEIKQRRSKVWSRIREAHAELLKISDEFLAVDMKIRQRLEEKRENDRIS